MSTVDDLVVSGVGKSYGSLPVLTGVDLVVPAGTLAAVLGRSGCGKTTLLRLVAGFDRPDAGSIRIGGRTVVDATTCLPPERRHVGYVTQDGTLFPHLTVAANIAFGLPRGARRDGRRVHELLELVGLDAKYAKRHPHELSGGQQQRVALARALAPKPGIVLLDEPFSSLDAELRESTRRAVAAALEAAGTTAVLVTHDQGEALSLASQVAVMWDGVIAQVAEPTELYRKPANSRIAGFVGDAVLLPAQLIGGMAECVLGRLAVPAGHADGPSDVLIRPEQIVIGGNGNGRRARVLGATFYGHDATVRLELADDGTTVTARPPGHGVPRVGQDVTLTVEGEVTVFDLA
jgi:iron(III) transport system ATP-binding protein